MNQVSSTSEEASEMITNLLGGPKKAKPKNDVKSPFLGLLFRCIYSKKSLLDRFFAFKHHCKDYRN